MCDDDVIQPLWPYVCVCLDSTPDPSVQSGRVPGHPGPNRSSAHLPAQRWLARPVQVGTANRPMKCLCYVRHCHCLDCCVVGRKFFRSPNFDGWYRHRHREMTHKLESLHLEVLAETVSWQEDVRGRQSTSCIRKHVRSKFNVLCV